MMKFIVETTQKENYEKGNDLTAISFFFNARGHHLEKSTTGLYRSMLFQVIQHNPGLKTILTSPTHFRGKSHRKWTNELLKELIEGAIERLTSSIICVIDALDECDDDEIRDMISFFERLGEVAVARRVGLLVCFSSRHYPHITMREGVGLELRLEEEKEHDADIAEYINSELRIGDSKHAQGIRNMVRERASGVFMWVVLVVNILNKERGRMHALRPMLRKIPQDLNALFFNILSRSSGNEDEVLLCFQLVLFARRPLTPLELHFAILSQVTNGNIEPGDLNEKEAQIFIVESSRGLAEITGTLNPTVQFIHQSVEDFLLEGDMLVKLWPKLGANLIGNSHLRLRDICLQYLSSDKTKLNTSKVNRNLERLRLLFPFMAYAVQNALYHADQAAKFGIQQQDFISSFPKSKWIKLYNLFFLSEKEYYPPDTRIIYILAEIDAPNLLGALPSTLSCIEIGSERYGCALLAAIIKESRNCFWVFRKNLIKSVPVPSESFLQKSAWATEILDLNTRPKLNLDWPDKLYPLATNHLRKLKGGLEFSSSKASLISYLLDHGDVELLNAVVQKDNGNLVAGQRSTLDDALSVASTRANEAVLKFLLQHDKGDVNFKCRVGRTPLSWAIRNGHTDVIKLLLSKIQTDPNLKDNNGWTPLSWAAGMGYVEVIKLLLATGRIEADTRDDLGRTAFSLAAGRGHTEVIKLLLSSGQTDPNSKDNCGRTPLYWAAGMGHAGVIKLLLASGLVDLNSRDNNGQTPLSLATERGHIEVIKILLLSGQTDPN